MSLLNDAEGQAINLDNGSASYRSQVDVACSWGASQRPFYWFGYLAARS